MKILAHSKDTRSNGFITQNQYRAINYIEKWVDTTIFEGTSKQEASSFIGKYLERAKDNEIEYLDTLPDIGDLY